jgi:hypothetical protein
MYLNIPLLIFTYLGEGNVKCPDGLSSESGYYPGCTCKYLSMAPPKDHAVGDLLIVAKLEFIWFTCCILMENS